MSRSRGPHGSFCSLPILGIYSVGKRIEETVARMRSWFPWKETEGLRVLSALRGAVSETQNMGIRLMNCMECMRMTPDFMDLAHSARNVLISSIGECLSSDRIHLSKAFEMAIGYSQGIQRLSQMTVREAFVFPSVRSYFRGVLDSFEHNVEYLRVGFLLWLNLGSKLKFLFSLSSFFLFFVVTYYASFLKKGQERFWLLFSMAFILSRWRFDRFHIPSASLFLQQERCPGPRIDGFLACREGFSFLFLFVESRKFEDEEKFLNFMMMFFHGQILCDERKNLRRRAFRMQFKKNRLSAQFVQDILNLVRGFFSFFLKSISNKLICS